MNDNEELRVVRRSRITATFSTLVIIAILALSALLLLTIGMQVYKNVVVVSEENFELRTSLSYVATKVRQSDACGKISVVDYDGTHTLRIEEELYGEQIITYIYYYNGYICEYLCMAEEEPEFEFGFETVAVDYFDVELEGNSLILSSKDAAGNSERLRLYLRSSQM